MFTTMSVELPGWAFAAFTLSLLGVIVGAYWAGRADKRAAQRLLVDLAERAAKRATAGLAAAHRGISDHATAVLTRGREMLAAPTVRAVARVPSMPAWVDQVGAWAERWTTPRGPAPGGLYGSAAYLDATLPGVSSVGDMLGLGVTIASEPVPDDERDDGPDDEDEYPRNIRGDEAMAAWHSQPLASDAGQASEAKSPVLARVLRRVSYTAALVVAYVRDLFHREPEHQGIDSPEGREALARFKAGPAQHVDPDGRVAESARSGQHRPKHERTEEWYVEAQLAEDARLAVAA